MSCISSVIIKVFYKAQINTKMILNVFKRYTAGLIMIMILFRTQSCLRNSIEIIMYK